MAGVDPVPNSCSLSSPLICVADAEAAGGCTPSQHGSYETVRNTTAGRPRGSCCGIDDSKFSTGIAAAETGVGGVGEKSWLCSFDFATIQDSTEYISARFSKGWRGCI